MKHAVVLIGTVITIYLLELVFAGILSAGPLTPQEKRGKQIYLRGTSPSGQQIMAAFGTAVEVPAITLPCANCHGFDGEGRPEGGAIPSNITWQVLTKPYGITHPSGRKCPPYTEQSLRRAITERIDPAGNQLAFAMPKYRLPPDDLTNLIAYLKRLGNEGDPGVTETTIRVGTILPANGPLTELGQVVKAVLGGYFDDINSTGGIYNRQIELQVVGVTDTATSTEANVKHLIEAEVFAVTGAFIAGADKAIAALIADEQVPLIGPFTLFPQVSFPLNRYIFYLFSGMENQSRALVNLAAKKLQLENPRIVIISPESEMLEDVTAAIEDQCEKSGWSTVTKLTYARGQLDIVQRLQELNQGGADAVFFLGSGEAKALMQELDKLRWTPHIFIPGSLAGEDIFDAPVSFKDKIYLSFPVLPVDQTPAGVMEYRQFAKKHGIPAQHLLAQLSTYCAAKIMVEGLKRTGMDLSREKLITTLEGLYEFNTGLTPLISYGPNRRIGTLGAHIVSIDLEKKAFSPVSTWMSPNADENRRVSPKNEYLNVKGY